MRTSIAGLVSAALVVLGGASPMIADEGDPAGWSVATDRRGRAFLVWTPEQGGERILMLGCLRDAETFTTMSNAVGERDEIATAKIALSNGPHLFEVDGSVTNYPHLGRSSFISDLDADRRRMLELGRKLMPVLEGKGDITLTITPGTAGGASTTQQLPTAGITPAVQVFAKVCFK